VVVHGAARDAGARDDLVGADRRVTPRAEQLARRAHDRGPRGLAALGSAIRMGLGVRQK
jgi:hypothetical protein